MNLMAQSKIPASRTLKAEMTSTMVFSQALEAAL